VNDPAFINKAAERYGSSTIVIHIDAKRMRHGSWIAWMENGREPSRRTAVEWAMEAAQRGCGEILVTSIDMEGTTRGFDRELCAAVSDAVDVPVVICGGASSPQEIATTASTIDIAAVCLSSILHYGIAAELEQQGYSFGAAGEFQVIAEKRGFSRVTPATIAEVKQALEGAGRMCRSVEAASP
jgi:imidazole glycerol-phosphate synthase subunit HisF